MGTKSKLRRAIALERGTDFKALKQKRRLKQAIKDKNKLKKKPQQQQKLQLPPPAAAATGLLQGIQPGQDDNEKDDNEQDDDHNAVGKTSDLDANLCRIDDSDSSDLAEEDDDDDEDEEGAVNEAEESGGARLSDDGEFDSEPGSGSGLDIPYSDLADSDREDVVPHTRLTINNGPALMTALARIALPAGEPFASHMCVTAAPAAAAAEPVKADDDLQRELAFYTQGLDAARQARIALRAEGVPFSRPTDYFAEMLKGDDHMGRVRARLVNDAAARRAAVDTRRQRDMRKFGKQVQIATLQDRQKAKRDTLDKIKSLKRKRKESAGDDSLGAREADDDFDVAVAHEMRDDADPRSSSRASRAKRNSKDTKFGFGGRKRFSKSGDALSSGDVSALAPRRKGRNPAGAPGGARQKPSNNRLGKARRKAGGGSR